MVHSPGLSAMIRAQGQLPFEVDSHPVREVATGIHQEGINRADQVCVDGIRHRSFHVEFATR